MTAELAQLVEAMGDTPVLVLGRFSDVLAWNRTGHALFAGHLDSNGPERPRDRLNMARIIFLDGHTRELYADWPAKARAVVGTLRVAAGRHPGDPAISALVGGLTVGSPEFSEMWAAHRVKTGGDATYEMRHPLVGAMNVTQQALHTEQGYTVVIATTEPGSPSREAMSLLAHSTAFTAAAQPAGSSPARCE
jgi:hypothetical protein